MSVDLREPSACVDRSGQSGEDRQGEVPQAFRMNRAAVPLVVGLSVATIAWLGDDAVHYVAVAAEETHTGLSIRRLPLVVNPRVEHWMQELQTARREELQFHLDQSGVFGGMIREKLRERSMPPELLYLAMIESGLSPVAESHVSAVGLWQFMDPTARELGLRVDDYVDERRDPVRATDAALDYLFWLRARYGSWYLAVAAYNAGPARVERVLELYADGRTGDEGIYWEVLRHLPRETREYVPRLIATALLAKDAEALGFRHSNLPAYAYEEVYVPAGTRLAVVARELDVPADVMRDLNPHLIRDMTPPREMYALRVPPGHVETLVASLGAGVSTRAD
ncbi:MAG: lytic transglycosylase domain-containing protein [Gemmatimonadetes bacterium]|nr:lytic transglycosylase domain-containing protein [Gemmatimonadota bacterium]